MRVECEADACTRRGVTDAEKRDAALAAKYLRPLSAYGTIYYAAKHPKPPAENGAKLMYMSTELTRVTPPRTGTAVYPGSWQLPGQA